MTYKPVEVKMSQWNKIFKIIRKAGKRGISYYELAEKMSLDRHDEGLRRTIDEMLSSSDRINKSIGMKDGMACIFLTALKETHN